MNKRQITTIGSLLISVLLGVICTKSKPSIILFVGWLIPTTVFICFIISYGVGKIFKKLSAYTTFAITNIVVGISVTVFSVYDIRTDTSSLFAGLLGKTLLLVVIPILICLLVVDFIMWLKKKNQINSDFPQ